MIVDNLGDDDSHYALQRQSAVVAARKRTDCRLENNAIRINDLHREGFFAVGLQLMKSQVMDLKARGEGRERAQLTESDSYEPAATLTEPANEVPFA